MNKVNLYNYIKLCKRYDLNTINNIYRDIYTNEYSYIHNKYNIPIKYIDNIKYFKDNGFDINILTNIYYDYHKMIGGKGGNEGKGTKGTKTTITETKTTII